MPNNRYCCNPSHSISYTYDNVGNATEVDVGGNYGWAYGYDNIYQATSADQGSATNRTIDWQYDSVYNRTAWTDTLGPVNVSYQANALHQYTQIGAGTPLYNNNGNIAYFGLNWTYDCENRLTSMWHGGLTYITYGYDLLGRRNYRYYLYGMDIRRYVYDGDHIIAEYNSNGSLTKKYIYGPGIDNPVAMINVGGGSETWFYYYKDVLGSIRLITNASGAVVEAYTYDPYGQPRVMRGAYGAGADGNWLTEDVWPLYNASAVGNRFMFTGREWDSTTQLYYYRARDYSPTLGRFLQPDPIGYADSLNLYQYCGNNPINFIDPWGLFHFGKRPLKDGKAPWFPGLSSNPIDNYFNTEISHEHGFFDDAKGGNIGFSPEGRYSETPEGRNYGYGHKYYDDVIMRQAVENVNSSGDFEPENYNMPGMGKNKKNCQDYCDALRKEYKRLGGKVYKNKEEYLKEKSKEKDSKKQY